MAARTLPIVRVEDGYCVCEGMFPGAAADKHPVTGHPVVTWPEIAEWSTAPTQFVPPAVGDSIEFRDDGQRILHRKAAS